MFFMDLGDNAGLPFLGPVCSREKLGKRGKKCSQLMNQTEAMVMEKKGPGLTSTLTNAAVRAKSSSMASRLPRMRTASGMLLGKGRGHLRLRPSRGRQARGSTKGRAVGLGQYRASWGRVGGLGQGLTTGTGRS